MSENLFFLPISVIRTDGGTQMRAGLDESTVHEYLIAMLEDGGWGAFPPVTVYHDGESHWLADGFHRLAAYRLIDRDPDGPLPCAPAVVKGGTRRDAVLHAAGANAAHGLRRSNADKRRAVETLLADREWGGWSDREIARRCSVHHGLVATLRTLTGGNASERTYTTKHGTVARMQTEQIGRGASPADKAIYGVESGGSGAGAGVARCSRCKRPLSDPASIAAGIGPCCRANGYADGGDDAGDEQEEDAERREYGFWAQNAQEGQEGAETANEPTETGNEAARRPHVAQASGDNEWYTPSAIIALARGVMGGIDLDPASSAVANRTVQADRYYDQSDNGLIQPWRGRVWLNPPYAGDLIGRFIERLAAAVETGEVTQAVVLVNNATETGWFRRLMDVCSVLCLPVGRISFSKGDGGRGAPLQGQAIIYVGRRMIEFVNEFGGMGPCFIRMVGNL